MSASNKYSWTEIALLKEKWGKLAQDNNGIFRAFITNDCEYRRFEITIPFGHGDICFNTNEFRPLKTTFEFSQAIDFEFLIYEEDYLDKISKLFGANEIIIGDELFDQRFFIKGDDPKRLKYFLTSNIRAFLLEHKICNFKLEKLDQKSILELNLTYNELDYASMDSLLHQFIDCIERVMEQENLSIS